MLEAKPSVLRDVYRRCVGSNMCGGRCKDEADCRIHDTTAGPPVTITVADTPPANKAYSLMNRITNHIGRHVRTSYPSSAVRTRTAARGTFRRN